MVDYILKIMVTLVENGIDIDHNQSYPCDRDIDPDYPETWVQFEYGGEIPVEAVVEAISYD